MLHRLPRFPVVLFTFFLLLVASGDASFSTSASPQTAPAKHGLTGAYYVSTLETHSDINPTGRDYFVQVWFDPNDFQLPKPFGQPAASRVDPQVAFGKGTGFVKGAGRTAPWAPAGYAIPKGFSAPSGKPWDHLAAVIWKGFIHLPKSGTYYFATVSHGASAVYLNDARVALNGNYGGVLVSDAFSYAKEDVRDFVHNPAAEQEDVALTARPGDSYVVPISIDRPRDVPIEVKYQSWVEGGVGIDLFWVTPDSPRDSNGKPVVQIVPADALYVEPPGTVDKPTARGANSTIAGDFFYFPAQSTDQSVTLTIRLADKDGNPVSGKRVHLSSVVSGGFADAVIQPEKPTDENGVTTGKIRGGESYKVGHDSAIFATDVTDLVDSAQVAHVAFQDATNSFFLFPETTFSGQYDGGKLFSVDPLPLRVGRPTTIQVPLINRGNFAAELTATFFAKGWNIGAGDWNGIGKVKGVRLRPGESTKVSITWTPDAKSEHICLKIEVNALVIAQKQSPILVFASSLLPSVLLADEKSGGAQVGSVQQNIGPVAPEEPITGGPCTFVPPTGKGNLQPSDEIYQEVGLGCKPNLAQKEYCHKAAWWNQKAANETCRYFLTGTPKERDFFAGPCQVSGGLAGMYGQCWLDPPDPSYRRLVAAHSETPAAYIEALTKSMERYQGAQADGDREWMARHITAIQLYERRLAGALRREADKLQERAEQLPSDDPNVLTKQQAADDELFVRLHHGRGLTSDESSALRMAGLSDEDIKGFVSRITELKERPPIKGPRAQLLDTLNVYRQIADDTEQLAGRPVNSGEEGKPGQPLAQMYAVGNPHDKEETVDLFIRPVSVPPDWKLSIVNAAESQPNSQAAKLANAAPQFPVQELEAGRHYSVTLPAKAQVKVASVVVPVGEIGARTTARWAVEGKIGDELIGGMVHEMNVPYIIADLQLPPVGSKEVEEELPVPSKPWARIAAEVAAAILILGLLVFLFIFFRKRQREAQP